MKNHLGGLTCILLIIAVITISWKPAKLINRSSGARTAAHELLEKYIDNIYETAHLEESGLSYFVFKKAVTGFIDLKLTDKVPQNINILTVVDLSKSSCEKRMFIIDVTNKQLLLNTWAAHGEGSGGDIATEFSDRDDSHQSSLGFYVTDNVYYGKHGLSLKMDGMDEGFNTSARARSIVVHGASYVGQGTINALGRLGHSYGCPAVANEVAGFVINTIKSKTVMFINGSDDRYSSKYLDEDLAATYEPAINAAMFASM